MATARFTVTLDLPTPPLPDATQYTLVSEPGWANGMTGSSVSPRRDFRRSVRCWSFITSSSTRTWPTPGSALTAAVTSLMILSRSGQPATVSSTATSTTPSSWTVMSLTMPRSVIGLWISGSFTVASAERTASTLGTWTDWVVTGRAPTFSCGDSALAMLRRSRPRARWWW